MQRNHLDHLKEFEALLRPGIYEPSEETLADLEATELVLMLGASSIGRNTIIEELVKTGKYHFIVSDTTRWPRVNNGLAEQNGREYWFKSEQEVLDGVRARAYVEAEVIHGQQVSGIHSNELKKALQSKKLAINEVDKGGVDNIVSLKPDTKVIMLLPPSFDEWQRRIHGRGVMNPDEFERRMRTARDIFALATSRSYFHFVINDSLSTAVTEVDAIAREGVPVIDQEYATTLAHELQDRTAKLLNSTA